MHINFNVIYLEIREHKVNTNLNATIKKFNVEKNTHKLSMHVENKNKKYLIIIISGHFTCWAIGKSNPNPLHERPVA